MTTTRVSGSDSASLTPATNSPIQRAVSGLCCAPRLRVRRRTGPIRSTRTAGSPGLDGSAVIVPRSDRRPRPSALSPGRRSRVREGAAPPFRRRCGAGPPRCAHGAAPCNRPAAPAGRSAGRRPCVFESSLQHDPGSHILAQDLVGNTGHHRFDHRRVPVERLFDLARHHVVSSPDDDVLGAAGDPEESVVVPIAEVTGGQPAILPGVSVAGPSPGVLAGRTGTPHGDLTDRARRPPPPRPRPRCGSRRRPEAGRPIRDGGPCRRTGSG